METEINLKAANPHDLSPTPLDDIKRRSGVETVELPGWGDGEPFVCKLRRLSLLQMAQTGTIPNQLLSAVTQLYQTGKITGASLSLAADVMCLMARQAMVEPAFDEMVNEGVTLTDQQLTAIYLYAQRGPESLLPFRDEPKVLEPMSSSPDVGDTAQRIAGDKGLLQRLLHR